MVQHLNFYETVKEARMRLERSVVLYDGKPYFVLAVDGHKPDGIFRMYLDDLTDSRGPAHRRGLSIPYDWCDEPGALRGDKMDAWLEKKPEEGVIRKMMNSPSFNKFRPFPLGMVNVGNTVVFTERQPTRSTFQGLTQQMINATRVSIIPDSAKPSLARDGVTITSVPFVDMLLGNYPDPKECLEAMTNPRIMNEGVAFHRLFALFRGPLDMLFLAYKGDVVGILTEHDFSVLRLGTSYRHLREVVSELGLFDKVIVKDI